MHCLILRSVICAAVLFHFTCSVHHQSEFNIPGDEWQSYSTPEEAGFDSQKLEEAVAFADSLGSAAVFVGYRGAVLVDWGETSRRFKCHSMRKSFLSALYGNYIDNGTIDVNKTLGELGIDDFPNTLTEQEKHARIVDLLSARSGIYLPAASEPARNQKPPRGSYPPGTHWCYNNWDFNMLLTVFEQETGEKIFRRSTTTLLNLYRWSILIPHTAFTIMNGINRCIRPILSGCPPATWPDSGCCS